MTPHADGHVWMIDGLLTKNECDQLITMAETVGFEEASVRTRENAQMMPSIRNNERVVFEDPSWVCVIWERLQTLGLPDIDGLSSYGLPRPLRFYKYSAGQRFKMHKDGAWSEDGRSSKLTLLIYLNDDFTGGATDFRGFVEAPKTGSAVLFLHDTWHEGQMVEGGVKYALRSDVLYDKHENE